MVCKWFTCIFLSLQNTLAYFRLQSTHLELIISVSVAPGVRSVVHKSGDVVVGVILEDALVYLNAFELQTRLR